MAADFTPDLDSINKNKHFDFKSDNIIDKYLCASFLGDDFLLSNVYKDKWAISNGRNYMVNA